MVNWFLKRYRVLSPGTSSVLNGMGLFFLLLEFLGIFYSQELETQVGVYGTCLTLLLFFVLFRYFPGYVALLFGTVLAVSAIFMIIQYPSVYWMIGWCLYALLLLAGLFSLFVYSRLRVL